MEGKQPKYKPENLDNELEIGKRSHERANTRRDRSLAKEKECKRGGFYFNLSIILVNDQHFCGDIALGTSIDNVADKVGEQRKNKSTSRRINQ